nr:hypothetical protein [Tanacetum cinerariifolium]
SLEDLEAQQNVKKVQEHLVDEEIQTMVEGTENGDAYEFMDEILIAKRILTLAGDALIWRKIEKGKGMEETTDTPTPIRHIKQSFMQRKDFTKMANAIKLTMKEIVPSMVDKRVNKIATKLISLYVAKGLLLDMQKAQTNIATLVAKAYSKMKDDEQARNAYLSIWWSLKIKFKKLAHTVAPCQIDVVYTHDHEDHHNDARSEGEQWEETKDI